MNFSKLEKMDQHPKPVGVKPLDNPTLNLQQPYPNQNPLGHTSSDLAGTLKPKTPVTGYHSSSSGTFQGTVGTLTLSDMLRIKREKMDL